MERLYLCHTEEEKNKTGKLHLKGRLRYNFSLFFLKSCFERNDHLNLSIDIAENCKHIAEAVFPPPMLRKNGVGYTSECPGVQIEPWIGLSNPQHYWSPSVLVFIFLHY